MSTKNYAARVTIGGALQSSFKQAFGGASTAIGKLKSEVQKLARTRKDIEAFRKAGDKISGLKSKLESAKIEAKRAADALAGAARPTAKLMKDSDGAARKVKLLEENIRREIDALNELEKKLGRNGITQANAARVAEQLESREKRKGGIIARQRRAEEKFGSARSRFGSRAASFGIFTGAVAAATVPAVRAAADFETAIERIKKTGDFSDADGASLKASVESLVAPTNRSETDLLGSAEQMAAAGAGIEQIKGSLREIGRASVATGASIEDLTKTSLAFQDNMRIAAKDSKAAFGIIATGAKAGNFEIEDMAKALPSVLARGSAIGMSGKEGLASAVAALEIARKGAGTNAEAQTNVENLLAKINSPETVKRFKEKFGVDWEKESKAAAAKGIDPLVFALDKIQKVTKGDGFRIGELFGDMQVKNALTPLIAFRKEFDQIRAEAMAGENLIDIDFAKSISTWPELINAVKNAFTQLVRMAGEELLPTVKDLFVSVAKVINKVVAWRKENPKLFTNIVKGAAAVATLTAAALALGVAAAGVAFAWSGLTLVFTAVGTIIASLGSPVAIVVAAITAAALTVRKYWEPISAFFKGVWEGIKQGWESAGGNELWEKITEMFGEAKKAIEEFLKPVKLSPEEMEKIFQKGQKVGEFIGKTLVGFFREAGNIINDFGTAFSDMGKAISNAVDFMRQKLEPFFKWYSETVEAYLGMWAELGKSINNWAKEGSGGKGSGQNHQGIAPSGMYINPSSLSVPRAKDTSQGQINNIQIHTQPGQSEQAVAQAVIRELRRMQESDARGSHWDGGEFAAV